MSNYFNQWRDLYDNLRYQRNEVPAWFPIDHSHIDSQDHDMQDEPSPFMPEQDYFRVFISEMFLANSRNWWSEYRPLVFSVTKFQYDKAEPTVPWVVGPNLLTQYHRQLPTAMRYINIPVTGIHPYIGGDFTLGMILYKVRQEDHLRNLLDIVERVASALDPSTALFSYLKMSDVLTDGIEMILGMQQTESVVGIQVTRPDGGFMPGYYALIDVAEEQIDKDKFWVRENRLYVGDTLEDSAPYRDNDFILLNTRKIDTHSDLRMLPFYPLWQEAQQLATDIESWKDAKNKLPAILGALIASPDLTENQKDKLMGIFRNKLKQIHQNALQNAQMGPTRRGHQKSIDFGTDQLRKLNRWLSELD